MELSAISVLSLMAIIALGCYIQTNTGFAFALIVMSLGGASGALSVPQLALVVSFLSLVNSTTALQSSFRDIDKRILLHLFSGIIPGALIGVWALYQLSASDQSQLKILLGLSVLGSALLLIKKPVQIRQRPSRVALNLSGVTAGVMGGLFSTFGPPIAYSLYRHSLAVKTLLSTMLATFWLTAIMRIVMVHGLGEVDESVYWLALIGAPWIVLCTRLSQRYPPKISEQRLRQCALSLLALSGLSLLATGLSGLG
ncbi:MAG: sulfite exporter TauE/SafE family protein [Cellvibrionaceae bacterium]